MSERIEQMIGEIRDMLLERMSEDDASVILNKVRDLAESSEYDGYVQGCDDTRAEFEEGYIDEEIY